MAKKKEKKNAKPEPLPLYNRDEKGDIKNKGNYEVSKAEFEKIEAEKAEAEKAIGMKETLSWRSIQLRRKQGA